MEYLEKVLPKKFIESINNDDNYSSFGLSMPFKRKAFINNSTKLCRELLTNYSKEDIESDFFLLDNKVFEHSRADEEAIYYNLPILNKKECIDILEGLKYNKYYELIEIINIVLYDCFDKLTDTEFIELYEILKSVKLLTERIINICEEKHLVDYYNKIEISNSYTNLLLVDYYNIIFQ